MCCVGCNNIKNTIKRLFKKYGNEKIEYIGVKNISFIFREYINKVYTMHIDEIIKEYGNITISELNCLSCRLSMYITSILICKKENIKFVADGARNSQLFAIEQNEMLTLFSKLFNDHNIELLFPVKNINNDFEEKNLLLARGIIPKVNESQCLLGMPLISKLVDKQSLKTCINIYNKLFKDMAEEIIKKYDNIDIGEKLI